MTRKASELLELVSTHELYFLQGGPKKYLCYVVNQLQVEGVLSIEERRLLSTTIYDTMDKRAVAAVGEEAYHQVFLLETLRILGLVSYDDELESEAYAREARNHWNEAIADLKEKGE